MRKLQVNWNKTRFIRVLRFPSPLTIGELRSDTNVAGKVKKIEIPNCIPRKVGIGEAESVKCPEIKKRTPL